MAYRVEFSRTADKQLDKLDHQVRDRIVAKVEQLADDPRPPGCEKLSSRPGFRIRVGTYRMIYEVHDAVLLVLVLELGHRREVYR